MPATLLPLDETACRRDGRLGHPETVSPHPPAPPHPRKRETNFFLAPFIAAMRGEDFDPGSDGEFLDALLGGAADCFTEAEFEAVVREGRRSRSEDLARQPREEPHRKPHAAHHGEHL